VVRMGESSWGLWERDTAKIERGKTVPYYLNYSSDARTFSYPDGSGTDLLAQAAVAHSQQITVKPWDLAIIEEK
jgi:beta-galactosidase